MGIDDAAVEVLLHALQVYISFIAETCCVVNYAFACVVM